MIGQKNVAYNYDKALRLGSNKNYPSLELVRLEAGFFKGKLNDELLEIGFGSGCNSLHLAKMGYKLTCVDIAKSAKLVTKKKLENSNISKKNYKFKILNHNYTKLPFKDSSFDFIVCMSVLSLLGSKKKIQFLLNELNRVLKENGKIILDINDHNSEFSKNKKKVSKDVYLFTDGYKNFRCYCPDSLKKFVKIISNFFYVEDKGYSSFKLLNRRINEWIVCGSKKL
jgi:ubiquinone/menaquinone biosynthesis C-methylase UbiE